MRIIYCDGGELKCSTIEVEGMNLIADGYRIVPIVEVASIITE